MNNANTSNPHILVIGDTHLRDSHMQSLPRGDDFTAAFRWCVQYAIDNKMAAVAHGGDLLNCNKPSSQNMEDLFSIHRLARENSMPVYVVTGNHDMAEPSWSAVVQDTFGDSEYGIICADNKRFLIPGTTVTLQGLPFLGREDLQKRLDEANPSDILLWHGLVKEFVGFPVEGAVEISDFLTDKFRAVLLGDIHVNDYRVQPSGLLIGYPGSTELCTKSEALEKYACVLEVPPTGPIKVPTNVVIPTRPARCFRVNVEEDLSRILAELQAEKFDRPPLIFIAYNPTVPGVITRIKNAVTAEAIVRYEALQETKFDLAAVVATEKVEAGVELKELIGTFLPPGKPRHLAEQLVDPDVNAKELVSAFSQTRLQELAEAAE